jgi:hypothetical protein
MKDKLKKKEKEKKKGWARTWQPITRSRSRSSPFVAIVPCTSVWDGVNAYKI